MSSKKERIGLFPGSFDPVTLGHLDLIRRAAGMVDRLYVGVLVNNSKKSLFSVDERVKMIQLSVVGLDNVEVIAFDGMTVDCCRKLGASVMIRGLRCVKDFEYELEIAQINRKLAEDVESVFLMTDPALSFVSSSTVRELGRYDADLSPYLPEELIPFVREKFAAREN